CAGPALDERVHAEEDWSTHNKSDQESLLCSEHIRHRYRSSFHCVGGGPGTEGPGGVGGAETRSIMLMAASAIDAPLLNISLLNELVAIPSIDAAAAAFFTSPLVTTVVMRPVMLVEAAKPSATLLASSVFPVMAPTACAVPVKALERADIVANAAPVPAAVAAGPLSGVERARPSAISALSLAT